MELLNQRLDKAIRARKFPFLIKMCTDALTTCKPRRQTLAFTLIEVVIAVGVIATVFAGVVLAYIQSARRAQWSGYSLAAQALAMQQLEQVRSAVWDRALGLDAESMNLNLIGSNYIGGTSPMMTGYTWTNLDIPYSGTNYVRATNFVTVSLTNLAWPSTMVRIRVVKVDTVWPFKWGSQNRVFTNTMYSYCAPDN